MSSITMQSDTSKLALGKNLQNPIHTFLDVRSVFTSKNVCKAWNVRPNSECVAAMQKKLVHAQSINNERLRVAAGYYSTKKLGSQVGGFAIQMDLTSSLYAEDYRKLITKLNAILATHLGLPALPADIPPLEEIPLSVIEGEKSNPYTPTSPELNCVIS